MPQTQPEFIHLHLHSAYSLAEGAIKIKDLMTLCKHNNMPAVAVTDTNNMFGAMEFALSAAKDGVQPIMGCQLDLGLEKHQLVFLVQSQEGYLNLSKIVSDAYMDGDPMDPTHIEWKNLEDNNEGLLCLTGGLRGPLGQYLVHNQAKKAEEALKKLKGIFGDRLYIELQRHELPEENAIEERLIDLAYKHDVPLVATNDCYFADRTMHMAHDALLCIAEGRYINEDKSTRRHETAEHYFKSVDEMVKLFADIPEAIQNTVTIAKRCHYLLKPIDPILPAFECEDGRTEVEEITAQSKEGLQWRLDNFVFEEGLSQEEKDKIAKPYWERLDYELGIIIQMEFPGYFLIVSDFIKWAKEQNIPVGPGRGSGAGSVVAWVLKITDLDPMRFGLLFERMLNPERVSMPDFDVDFCQERREEVIKYVQDKYGHDKVAQIITFGKLQARAVVRDVGRVLQMPYGQVDRISKMIPNNPAAPMTLQEALDSDPDLRMEVKREETTQNLVNIALKLEGLYRHASTHAAGVVIGDRPLHELVPLYRDPRSDMPVTQLNMKFVELTGLVKFDFLGLKTMTVIQKALELVKDKGEDVDILKVPFDDKASFEMMANAQTTGVFQLESAGMRDTLRKMKPDRFEDIIALVALYRPGPMDNIPLYCQIKAGEEEPDYMHEKLKPFLEETYGIMIYQEQVMQAAQALSGYSLGGADLLRRAMGKKIQAEMDEQRALFMDGAAEHNNVGKEQSSHIFDQIAKFAGYGFNKSHAAAYALIAYWTAWLKANHPTQFMAASMTLDLGNTDKLAIFKQGLDRMGIELLPPDVNESLSIFKVEGDNVRYALGALKGVGADAMDKLVAERDTNGPFKSLQDLASRVEAGTLNRRQFERLASAGAFDSLEPNRAQAHASAEILLRHAQALAAERQAGQNNLFGGDPESGGLQAVEAPETEDWITMDRLRREFEAVGFYLSAHPLDNRTDQLDRLGIVKYTDVEDRLLRKGKGGGMMDMAGILMKKQIKVSPKTGNKYAFLSFSDSSGVYEVMMFSDVLNQCKDILIEGEPFLIKAIAERQEEQIRFTIQNVKPLDKALDDKVMAVHIELDGSQPVAQLKALLDAEGRGKVTIKIFVKANDNITAEMELPGRYNLSGAAREALLKAEGVLSIREQ